MYSIQTMTQWTIFYSFTMILIGLYPIWLPSRSRSIRPSTIKQIARFISPGRTTSVIHVYDSNRKLSNHITLSSTPPLTTGTCARCVSSGRSGLPGILPAHWPIAIRSGDSESLWRIFYYITNFFEKRREL